MSARDLVDEYYSTGGEPNDPGVAPVRPARVADFVPAPVLDAQLCSGDAVCPQCDAIGTTVVVQSRPPGRLGAHGGLWSCTCCGYFETEGTIDRAEARDVLARFVAELDA